MKKVLITGFEPFGHRAVNASWLAVSLLCERWHGDAVLVPEQLPVAFEQSGPALVTAVNRVQPDIVICVGEAGGRSQVTPELVGINWDDAAIPDNAGNQRTRCRIEEDGPAARFTGLPVYDAVDRMRENGIPAKVSTTAGTYLCNHVMYVLGGLVESAQKPTTGGFCHVPFAPVEAVEGGAASMSTEVAAEGLRILLETTLECVQ
jgi:pyroglutamyl-peptidase